MLLSIVDVPIYIPTNSVRGSLLSTPSPAFIIRGFFDDSYSGWYEVISDYSFGLHFCNN